MKKTCGEGCWACALERELAAEHATDPARPAPPPPSARLQVLRDGWAYIRTTRKYWLIPVCLLLSLTAWCSRAEQGR